ncbi:MAG: 5-oxoprolinase [Desulfurococcales archaeon ex4484_42]|nr:MAG: 5-oxoprolinase [Desulfurococcales archaeon ex4484_42]
MDPITIEVIKYATIFIAEEMGIILRNTAFSPNIKDRHDHSCAIATASGEIVAQAEHIPVHLGSLFVGIKNVLEYLSKEGISLDQGDIIITNDPYIAGTHLNDVMLLKPIYVKGKILGYLVNKAHHVDVGEDIIKVLQSNVRVPKYFKGDLMAQIASLNVGEKRILELINRYGYDVISESWNEILAYTEKFTRSKINELVKTYDLVGIYEASEYMELSDNSLVKIKVSVSINSESIHVDFSGTDPQVNEPINAVYGVTVAATTFALKAVIDPQMPMNSGFYRVIRIQAPKGSLVNPEPPAPVGGGNVETSQRIVDVIFKALSKALLDRVPAASCGTMTNVIIGGKNWVFYETIACGSGGRPSSDGVDGVHTNMTNTLNTPIEVIEQNYPILFIRYELRRDSEGPGKYRGGLGITRAFKVLEDNVILTIFSERSLIRPWGIAGGKEALPSEHYVIRSNGKVERLGSKGKTILNKGDIVVINTPGGGGYGDPCTRDRELILKDISEGKISVKKAMKYYCFEEHG